MTVFVSLKECNAPMEKKTSRPCGKMRHIMTCIKFTTSPEIHISSETKKKEIKKEKTYILLQKKIIFKMQILLLCLVTINQSLIKAIINSTSFDILHRWSLAR